MLLEGNKHKVKTYALINNLKIRKQTIFRSRYISHSALPISYLSNFKCLLKSKLRKLHFKITAASNIHLFGSWDPRKDNKYLMSHIKISNFWSLPSIKTKINNTDLLNVNVSSYLNKNQQSKSHLMNSNTHSSLQSRNTIFLILHAEKLHRQSQVQKK